MINLNKTIPDQVLNVESNISDYITLIKPGVLALVVFTSIIPIFIAPSSISIIQKIAIIISITLASCGSAALNMWYDSDIDAVMKRTKNRPTVTGAIPPSEALAFGILVNLLAIILMALCANYKAAALLAFASIFYSVIYTIFLKRYTIQNIVIGGAAGALPPVIAWVALTDQWNLTPWLLFLIIFLWTPPHFWALAIHYKKDYQDCNVPMMVNVKGVDYTKKQIVIYTILMIISSILPYVYGMCGYLYLITASILGLRFLYLTIRMFQDNSYSIKTFLFSIVYLFSIFGAILVDHFIII
jgi:protoheme IX farnesyltransferase